MKRLSALLCLCFALITISSLGQLSFTNPFVSNSNLQEWTITEKTYGKLLTLSTKKGFAWILADPMAIGDKVYVSFACVSSGSVVDFGLGTYVSNGYPNSYMKNSVIIPVVGGNFAGLNADSRSWYHPTRPTLGASSRAQYTSLSDKLFMFQKQSGSVAYEIYQGSSQIYTGTAYVSTLNTVSFEVLNSGSATFCIQTDAQYQQSQGVCEPGETITCQAPTTSSTVSHQTDCSTASSFIIDNLSCVSQCTVGTADSISGTLSVCPPCTSPCSECISTLTTCTSCIANNYLDSDTCGASCPNNKFKNEDSMTCDSSCKSPCQQCDEFVDKCTSCIANNYLDGDTCGASCPNNKFKNEDSMTCDSSCKSPCQQCDEFVDKCTSCIANNYLDGDTCAPSCPNNKFKNEDTLSCDSSCKSPCQQCDEFVDKCTSCITNYFLYKETCVNPCPEGYTGDSVSGECKLSSGPVKLAESSSSGFATWKLALVIGLPVMSALAGILIFIKVKGMFKGKAYRAKETPQDFNQLPTTPTPTEASPAIKGIDV